MLKGYVDRCDDIEMAGWVVDTDAPHRPLEIIVLINGRRAVQCTADLSRLDLEAVIGSSNHGFQFGITEHLTDGENQIDLRIGPVFDSFDGFPRTIHFTSRRRYVEEGRDGWLFLQNDSNSVNDTVIGNRALSGAEVQRFIRILLLRSAFAESIGALFSFIVVPEKNVICNKLKYNPLSVSQNRPAIQIGKALGKLPIKFFYPVRSFSNAAEKYFLKTDTHISDAGKLKIFGSVLSQFGIERGFPTVSGYDDFTGDLGEKLDPPRSERILRRVPRLNNWREVDTVTSALSSGGHITGNWVTAQSDIGHEARVLLLGTSSAYYMRHLFFAQFREVLFYWSNEMDIEFVRRFRPNIIVSIYTERILKSIPNDLDVVMPARDLNKIFRTKRAF